MKVFAVKELANLHIQNLKKSGNRIGLIPTMGALHQGHISLIERAKEENDVVVVSIFVNPTQFNNPEDLQKYPRTLEADLEKLSATDCDLVFAPQAEEMYQADETAELFDFAGLDKEMEGKFRDNHFNGVGTILKKLFSVLIPNNAYFGEKDFQQLQIVKKLVNITQQPVNIVGCPIHREADGLAMSSRNMRLTTEHRASAPFIYQTLLAAQKKVTNHTPKEIEQWVVEKFNKHNNLVLEYFSIADEATLKPIDNFNNSSKYRAFIAVFAGEIRLIDNLELSN
ncbi:pantoate--beta-alanine ligase [Ochrovirga pacifica]|uniref:pantoate--beta-alanine ligase n=1 Tax=Ochrovirga pacifica TaxID=1042376 RepID=UPI0002559B07|nr:pantoate--beta-alanine ligase [Ochrovirga pacifica]